MLKALRRAIFGESAGEMMERVRARMTRQAFSGPDGRLYVTWDRAATRAAIFTPPRRRD